MRTPEAGDDSSASEHEVGCSNRHDGHRVARTDMRAAELGGRSRRLCRPRERSQEPAEPASPPAPEPSPQEQRSKLRRPNQTRKRSLARLARMHPGQLEALMLVVFAVIGRWPVCRRLLGEPAAARHRLPVGTTPNAVAVDPTTNTIYVTNNLPDTLSVVDGDTHEVIATVPVGAHPDGVAVDPGTHTVYVANSDSHTVSVIDGSTHTVIATVPVGNTPMGVAVDPETHNVYVANNGHPELGVGDRRVDAHRHRHRARRQRPVRGGGGSEHQHRLRHQLR